LFISSVALLLLSIFLDRFLNGVALLVWDIMALFLCLQSTLRFGDVVNLSLGYSVANLFVIGVAFLRVLCFALLFVLGRAFLFISRMAFFFRNISALLFRHTIYSGYLLGGALLLVVACGEGFLHVVALLTRFIPALLVVHSGATRNTT